VPELESYRVERLGIVTRPHHDTDLSPWTHPVGTIAPLDQLLSAGYAARPIEGETLSRADYPELYAAVLDKFGEAPEGEFRLPDLRARVVKNQGEESDVRSQ
jgi:hypothetical protein